MPPRPAPHFATGSWLDAYHLGLVETYWPWTVAAALASHLLVHASSQLSPRLFPRAYRALAPRKQLDWDVHVVALVHAVLVSYFAVDLLRDPVLRKDKVWGYTDESARLLACVVGYFIWDVYICIKMFREFGWQMLAHAIASGAVYLFGLGPFINYYGATFILFEVSTPFLNVHWFVDKCGMTGSRLQMVNGLFLIVSFFLVRIVWATLYEIRQDVPLFHFILYATSNALLTLFNFIWFAKIIDALRRRMAGAPKNKPSTNGEPANVVLSDAASTETSARRRVRRD